MKRNSKKSLAFTLIELLVVIAIIGILSTLTVVLLQNSRAKSRDSKRIGDVKQMQTALEMYFSDWNTYPTTAQWGTRLATGSNVYLETIPQAPAISDGDCGTSSQAYTYESDGTTYSLSFCTGNKVNDFPAGNKEATPGGIFSSAPAPLREKTWRTVALSKTWMFVDMSSDGEKILMGTLGGYMYLSSDGGDTFSELTSLGTGSNWRLNISDNGLRMIATSQLNSASPPKVSLDSGATWTSDTAAGNLNYTGTAISNDGAIRLAAVYPSYPKVSINSGSSYSTVGYSAYHHNASCSSDCSKMLVVAGGGYPAVSTDSGTSWTQKTALLTAGWYGATVSGDGTKMAVSSIVYSATPKVHVSTDTGSTWSDRTPPVANRNWISVSYSADGNTLAVADYGGYVYISTDNGVNWTQQTSIGARNWRSVAASNEGEVVAVADSGQIYIYD